MTFTELNMQVLYFFESLRNPILDFLMELLTNLGDEAAFLAMALLVFWCVDKNKGYFILSIGFVGTVINQLLKILCMIPRPWVIDPDFSVVGNAMESATGYSFPSGHTQNTTGTFGAIALITNKRPIRILCFSVIALIPLTRMYLGVHTPIDVFTSLLIGTALIFAFYPLFKLTDKKPNILYYTFLSFFAIIIGVSVFAYTFPFSPDVDIENLYEFRKVTITLLGTVSGFIVCYPIESRFIKFDPKIAPFAPKYYVLGQGVKLVTGLALILGIKEGLKALFKLVGVNEFGEELLYLRSIRYFIVVAVASTVIPLIFKLMTSKKQNITEKLDADK